MHAWRHPFAEGLPAALPDDALLPMMDVVCAAGARPEEVAAAVDAGRLAEPVGSPPRWRVGDVRAWLDQRSA